MKSRGRPRTDHAQLDHEYVAYIARGKSNGCVECNRRRERAWRAADPARARKSAQIGHLRYLYGIDVDEYNEMFARQGGRCAVCNELPLEGGKRLGVDHDHMTGKIRGLLCARCNLTLGFVVDNPQLLASLANHILASG